MDKRLYQWLTVIYEWQVAIYNLLVEIHAGGDPAIVQKLQDDTAQMKASADALKAAIASQSQGKK
jgi:hypothetical protein